MLTFLGEKDIVALDDRYYTGRWSYIEEAARLCRQIPEFDSAKPSDVLEIGPYRLPLVPGCDTFDNCDHGLPITYRHDAASVPWPIATGRYRLLVALQVWEHLRGRQQEAWGEVRRVADWAVLSLPHLWPEGTGEGHAGISLDTITGWAGQIPLEATIVPSGITPLSRIVCLYNLKSEDNDRCRLNLT